MVERVRSKSGIAAAHEVVDLLNGTALMRRSG
jgi:hypothetical protein